MVICLTPVTQLYSLPKASKYKVINIQLSWSEIKTFSSFIQSFIFGLQVQIVCQIIELYEQLHNCCRSTQSLSERYSAHSSTKDTFSQAVSHHSLLSLGWIFTNKPKSRIISNYGTNLTSICDLSWHIRKSQGGTLLVWTFLSVFPLPLL